jgi:hypothetical protein
VTFLSLFIYLAFKHCSLIKSFNSLISSHAWYWITVCKAPFTWDRDKTKLEWKLKLSTCFHETGMKITKFSIYSPCKAIFFFRWLFLACVVHLFQCQGYIRDRSEMYLCLHSFRSEFMPAEVRLVWVIFVPVSCKHLLYWNCQHVYMRPVWKSQNFQFIPLARQFSFLDGFCWHVLFTYSSNVKVTSETSLKCICVYIHSIWSEFMPVWSQSARSSRRNDLRLVWVIFSPVSCKHLL